MSINPIYPRETAEYEYYCEECDTTTTEPVEIRENDLCYYECPHCMNAVYTAEEFYDEPDECRVPF